MVLTGKNLESFIKGLDASRTSPDLSDRAKEAFRTLHINLSERHDFDDSITITRDALRDLVNNIIDTFSKLPDKTLSQKDTNDFAVITRELFNALAQSPSPNTHKEGAAAKASTPAITRDYFTS